MVWVRGPRPAVPLAAVTSPSNRVRLLWEEEEETPTPPPAEKPADPFRLWLDSQPPMSTWMKNYKVKNGKRKGQDS